MYTYSNGSTRSRERAGQVNTDTQTHRAKWGRSPSDTVVWFALTATATQSLSALYWVTAITGDQVANKLQAVPLWEGHTHTRSFVNSCTHTQKAMQQFAYFHTLKHNHGFNRALLKSSISHQSPPVHQQRSDRGGGGEMKMRTDRRHFSWMGNDPSLLPSSLS